MPIALDATYSLGRNLSGIGVYSRRMLQGLARAHPEQRFLFCYRPHRYLRSWQEPVPRNASRRLLRGTPRADLFHGLNQRVDFRTPRTVTTFHDLFVLTGEYSSSEFRARFAAQAREAAARSDLIIAVSKFTAGQVENLLGVEPSRIRVVPHGVDTPGVVIPSVDTRAVREPIVLFVGALQRRKNIARLIRAFERLPDPWKLVLAGSAEGYGAAEELRAAESSPRKRAIEVLGYVSDAELAALYRRASIFAFPSLDEGFGMPVLEAMARGIPVLTSRRSALPEAAGGAAVLVDPEDEEELAGELLRLATDDDLRRTLSDQGLARAAALPWTLAIERTWAVYQELGLG